MNRLDVASALAELVLRAFELAPQSNHQRLWTQFQHAVDGLELTRSEACHALYDASGPSVVIEYAQTVGHKEWGWCDDCDHEVPIEITVTGYDSGAFCLVCWSDLSLLEGESEEGEVV